MSLIAIIAVRLDDDISGITERDLHLESVVAHFRVFDEKLDTL